MKSKQIEILLKKRSKLLSRIEVVNYEISVINHSIAIELTNKFLGKKIQFNYNNDIIFNAENGDIYQNISSDKVYTIIEIISANTNEDIKFIVSENNKEKFSIVQNQLTNFKFV